MWTISGCGTTCRYSVSPKRRQCSVSSSIMKGLRYVEVSRGLLLSCVTIISRLDSLCAFYSIVNDYSAVCLKTGPQPLAKHVLRRGRSIASSSKFQYLLVSLRASSSCLRLLPSVSSSILLLLSNFSFISAVSP